MRQSQQYYGQMNELDKSNKNIFGKIKMNTTLLDNLNSQSLYSSNYISYPCKLPSILVLQHQYQTYFGILQDGNKMKLRRVTLPNGSMKLEVVPPTSKEIEKRNKLKEEIRKRKPKDVPIGFNTRKEYRKFLRNKSNEERQKDRTERRFIHFTSKVKDSNGCLIYKGHIMKGGYGRIQINGKAILAHRYAYERVYGKIPDEKVIMHLCNNPSCVNVEHLVCGNQYENILYMVKCGNSKINRKQNGENNNATHLTWENIKNIRELYKNQNISHCSLGKMFNVSSGTISLIINNKTWSDKDYIPPNKEKRNMKIISFYVTGKYTHNEIAKMFNLSRSAISLIIEQYSKNQFKDD